MDTVQPLSRSEICRWVICLALVAVGLRNFELGMSADGPIYSTIARNIARTGEWFRLDPGVPDFQPFAEHPHLGFWVLALVFKFLPAADWSARLPGHFFYVAFLCLLFGHVRKLAGESTAVGTVLLLWMWSRFSNPFSNGYLDPGALFFGFAAIVLWDKAWLEKKMRYAVIAGLSLALCTLYKGLTALGFLPPLFVTTALRFRRRDVGFRLRALGFAALSLAAVLAVYATALARSAVPDFLTIYWTRQMTQRFSQIGSLANFFNAEFWTSLTRDTYYLLPLSLLALRRCRRDLALWLPVSLSLSFIFMYACNLRAGMQYFLPILPGVAWTIALGVLGSRNLPVRATVRASSWLAITAVVILQYVPFRAHGMAPSGGEEILASVAKARNIKRLWIDGTPTYTDFINASRYAWWGDVQVSYVKNGEPVPPASADSAYLLFWPAAWALRHAAVSEKNWCLWRRYPERSLWVLCPVSPERLTP